MKNIYILYGENAEAIRDFQKEIVNKFLNENVDNFNYLKFNMLETTIEDIIYECSSSGFFTNKKVIIAENSIFLQSQAKKSKVVYNLEKLTHYLEHINEEVILIFTVIDNIDSRKKIVKIIREVGEVKEFKNFKEKELENYIVAYFKEKNLSISFEDAKFLVFYSRLDFAGMKKELEKLVLYCAAKNSVSREDVEKLITKSLEYDIFSLTNELFNKNYLEFRKAFESLKLKGEEPILLLSLITSQLRIYYKVKMLLQENFSQKDIASKLKIHPYRVQLAVQSAYKYELTDLMESIIICKEYDKKLKSSYIDKYVILDLFINKLIEKLR